MRMPKNLNWPKPQVIRCGPCPACSRQAAEGRLRPQKARPQDDMNALTSPHSRKPRCHDQTLLLHAEPKRRSGTHRRIPPLSRKDLARNHPEHSRFGNRGHGNLSPGHAHVHDHGSGRNLFLRKKSKSRCGEPESSAMGRADVEVPEAAAEREAWGKVDADGEDLHARGGEW